MLDLAIIGGGPAGLSAGLYATRGGLKNVVMFEKGLPGGQIMNSSEIENYPGQAEVVSGMDLMAKWPEQCQRFGLKHDMIATTQITQNEDKTFNVHLEDGRIEKALTVLIATGSTPKQAGFDKEMEFFGKGVSTCATCDGFFYKNKEVAVIGGGDTALEEAFYLAGICSKVYLIHRRDSFRAAPSTIDRLNNTKNIEQVLNASVKEVYGDAMGVNGIIVNTKDGKRDINAPGVFVFVGNNVNNGVLKQDDGSFLCNVEEWGEITVDIKMKTTVDGLYAGGDVRLDAPKQVVCAAGDGVVAALQVISHIDHIKNS